MKYQTAKYADGIFTVNCPHCSTEVAVDEGQLEQINTQLAGKYACPIEGCGKDIEFPNAEEAAELKVPTASSTIEPTVEESVPSPVTETSPAPSPPPQMNPAAKSTQPPLKAPVPAPKSAVIPSQPDSKVQPKGPDSDFAFGFHGSKGASLEREAATVRRISMKTILHGDCLKNKKDTFDETVTQFLKVLDEECLIGVYPVQYASDEKKGTDFGVMIVYKTTLGKD